MYMSRVGLLWRAAFNLDANTHRLLALPHHGDDDHDDGDGDRGDGDEDDDDNDDDDDDDDINYAGSGGNKQSWQSS